MFAEIGGHAPNHSELVDLLGDVGEEIGQFDTGFPVGLGVSKGSKNIADIVELGAFDLHRHGLSMQLSQHRLGIERIHMGYAARHVEENNRLGPGGVVKLLEVAAFGGGGIY